VPHMGWNQVVQKRPHPLWAGIESGTHFYFVHSYHVVPKDPDLWWVPSITVSLVVLRWREIMCLPRSFILRKATKQDSLY